MTGIAWEQERATLLANIELRAKAVAKAQAERDDLSVVVRACRAAIEAADWPACSPERQRRMTRAREAIESSCDPLERTFLP